MLSRGTRFQVGNGNNISIWNDPWLPLPHSFKPFSLPMEGTESWVVADIIDLENRKWVSSVIIELFIATEADLILKIPLGRQSTDDRLMWHYDNKGVFNVKSGYQVARMIENMSTQTSSSSSNNNNSKKLWNKVWQARIPPKVRAFTWRLMRGILPTQVALSKKVVLKDTTCIFCGASAENDFHIFKYCQALFLECPPA